MTEVFVPSLKLVIQMPDCSVCGDRGYVESPVLDWRGRQYVGHGPCTCSVCRSWPKEMADWAERAGYGVPGEAAEAVKTGKALRHSSLMACRSCENGRRFHAWVRLRKDKNSPADVWSFRPEGWRKVDHRSPEGQMVLRVWQQLKGDVRGVTMADVVEMVRHWGRPVPAPARHPAYVAAQQALPAVKITRPEEPTDAERQEMERRKQAMKQRAEALR